MHCPKCSNKDTSVLDSRVTHDGKSIRRRRECDSCHARFTTFERVEMSAFIVVKRDNSRESYSREKVERGIWRACEKRAIGKDQIDRMMNELEEEWSRLGKEVPSQAIGEAIMERLRKIDDVAYIRFASVYRQFRDIETFKKELQKLLD